jgi:Uma2 family endonuclease
LGQHSAPQPDLVVLKRRADFYRHQLPGPNDVLLVVEVADASIEYDRTVKLPLYATHGIAEAWLVDLQNRRLEIYRDVRQGQYGVTEVVTQRDRVIPEAFSDVSIELDTILS